MSTFGFVLTLLAAFLTAAANVCLRKGFAESATDAHGLRYVVSLLSDPVFVVGSLLYVVAMLTWFRIISVEPVGSAYPILVGLTFFFLMLGGAAFVNEPLSWAKVSGTLFILLGVTIVARS